MRHRAPSVLLLQVNPALGLTLMWWELYFAAAETIGHRLSGLALAGFPPSAMQARENRRMVSEKAEAMLETASAMWAPSSGTLMPWLHAWRPALEANARLAGAFARYAPWNPFAWLPVTDPATTALMVDTLRPWHRRATANAKRLRGRRRVSR